MKLAGRFIPIIFLLFLTPSVIGQVRIPAILGSGMVLQQNSEVKLWGWAEPGERIQITGNWLDKEFNTISDREGKWMVTVPTLEAGGPYRISIKGINEIVLDNILFGEVWVCSGQSNMQYSIYDFRGWDIPQYEKDKIDFLENDYSQIRLFDLQRNTSSFPQDDCVGEWTESDLELVENFSAVAWFFARKIHNDLDVPVGLISTNWGGTPAEAWTSEEALESNSDLEFYTKRTYSDAQPNHKPSLLFNAMINPLLNFRIKGVIWYQGEANTSDALHYRDLFPSMIKDWRNKFGQGNFPFYYVQIAPFRNNEPLSGALLREAQLMTLSVPGTGMVVTTDIGNIEDIHPVNKQEVGRRLALIALAKTYKFEDIEYSGPIFTKFETVKNGPNNQNMLRLYFDHAGAQLVARGDSPSDFHIAGNNRIFRDAKARIDGNTILVWNEDVKDPQSVRFGFTNTDEPNLFNSAGLPASPFRTDDWHIYTGEAKIRILVHKRENAHEVELIGDNTRDEIRYTLDGSDPDISSRLYKRPFHTKDTVEIRARAFLDNTESAMITKYETKPHRSVGENVKLRYPIDARYTGGGPLGLVDGIFGSEKYTDEAWLGFEAYNFHAIIKLERAMRLKKVSIRFLENQAAWIFLPAYVEILYSMDGGVTYESAKQIITSYDKNKGGISIEVFEADIDAPQRISFIKIFAKNLKIVPAWHPGYDEKGRAWIFTDEIIIE